MAKHRWGFLGIAAAALALRVLYLARHSAGPFFEPRILDPAYYHEWALSILRGKAFVHGAFFGLPLYPFFLAAVYKIAGVSLFAVKGLQVLLGLVHIGAVYALGRRLFESRGIALGAAALAGFYVPYLFHETMLVPEAIAVPLYTFTLLAAFRFWRGAKKRDALLLGGTAALAGLTKAAVFLFVPIFLGGYLALRRGQPARLRFMRTLIAAGTVILFVAPVTLHNWKHAGDFVPLTWHGGLNFFIGNNPGATGIYMTPPGIRSNIEGQIADSVMIAERETGRRLKPSEVSRFWFARGTDFIRSHPRDAARLWAKKLLYLMNRAEISDGETLSLARRQVPELRFLPIDFGVLFALAVPGFLFGFAAAKRPERTIAVLWIASCAAGVLAFFVNARYRLPLVSPLFPFAAYTVWRFGRAAQTGGFVEAVLIAAAASAAFFVSVIPLAGERLVVHLTNAGNAEMQRQRPEAAVALYREAIAVDPAGYAKVYTDLGVALRATGRTVEAKAAFEEAIRLNPADPHAHNNLGLIFDALGNLNRAELLFRKTIALQPNLPEAHNNLGMVLGKQARWEEAEQALREALRLKPENPRALTNLGLVCYYTGRRGEAVRLWQNALRIDPSYKDAQTALQGLRGAQNSP